ncbi:NUDIX hydrolase [Candidatus Nomurabacteria bacterium]|nr:NUDIX hydrolase [Candidatus Nomurabacteria bacterium]
MKVQFTIGVFGIIFNEKQEILLCHRRDFDLWNLPGGGLENGETPWEGTIREVKEETGLDVEIINLTGIYNKPGKNALSFSFICEVIAGQIILNDEADKIEYFSLEKLPKNTVPKQVERIKDAFENHKYVVLKNQTGESTMELLKRGKL